MASITCGKCQETHTAVGGVVRACHAGAEIGPCGWLVGDGYDEDGTLLTSNCGAETIYHPDGSWECADGHSYVSMETRYRQGWDYAEAEEAAAMSAAGVRPVVVDAGLPLFVGHGAR